MLDQRFELFPLTNDEKITCDSILQVQGSHVMVMPTHHINEIGHFMGFRYSCPLFAQASTLPLNRNMFHGTMMVQCDIPDDKILQLMLKKTENKALMQEFLQEMDQNCIPATLDCIPENSSALTKSGTVQSTGLRSVDSKHWTPEVPDRIGLYHAYIKGYNRDVRTHRLFIICTSGTYKACDEFCNLVIDVGSQWTVNDVMTSEEAWWLKRACQRARARTIRLFAEKFDLPIPTMQDIQSYKPQSLSLPTTETLEHDLSTLSNGDLVLYNGCIDTTKKMNGILCNMHPSEGVMLFKGSPKAACFGTMYGNHTVCGTFPVNAPIVDRLESMTVLDSSCIVRHASHNTKTKYMCFDESYYKNLEGMQWNRDYGMEALIPIVVGLK